MKLPFIKMQGAGNDFVVLDARTSPLDLPPATLTLLADRRRGVGCDQVLVVEPAREASHAAHYRIFNADGSEAEQCGNGVRCIARFLADHGGAGRHLTLGSLGGPVAVELQDDGQVRVDMGPPRFAPSQVPFLAEADAPHHVLRALGSDWTVGVLSMGNPHAVLRVDDVDTAPVAMLGPAIEQHERFPQRTNVGFLQLVDREHARLRVHERGVGETLACGTGACAAAVWGMRTAALAPRVAVSLPGGTLVIEWRGEGHPVFMTGPATEVYRGEIDTP